MTVPFRGSLALLCAACRTFVDTLVLLCGLFAYYMASYLLYILPPYRVGPRCATDTVLPCSMLCGSARAFCPCLVPTLL